jgi:tape measure domain-containing protein
MTQEILQIVVESKVDPSIEKNFDAIGNAASYAARQTGVFDTSLGEIDGKNFYTVAAGAARMRASTKLVSANMAGLTGATLAYNGAARDTAFGIDNNVAAMNAQAKSATELSLEERELATWIAQEAAFNKTLTATLKQQELARKAETKAAAAQAKASATVATASTAESRSLQAANAAEVAASHRLQNLRRDFETTASSILRINSFMGVLSAALVTSGYGKVTAEFTDFNSELTRMAGNAKDAVALMDELHQSANTTYTSFKQTAQTFVQNYEVLGSLGYTLRDTLSYTESLNNAMVISGVKGQQAASVLMQLSQALSLGYLRGQDFNSVMSEAPYLMTIFAKAMNVQTYQLRQMASNNQITTNVMMSALLKYHDMLQQTANNMPATMLDSITRAQNNIEYALYHWDLKSGLSRVFANTVISLSTQLETIFNTIAASFTALMLVKLPRIATFGAKAIGRSSVIIPTLVAGGYVVLNKAIEGATDNILSLNAITDQAFTNMKESAYSIGQEISLLASDMANGWEQVNKATSGTSSEMTVIAEVVDKAGNFIIKTFVVVGDYIGDTVASIQIAVDNVQIAIKNVSNTVLTTIENSLSSVKSRFYEFTDWAQMTQNDYSPAKQVQNQQQPYETQVSQDDMAKQMQKVWDTDYMANYAKTAKGTWDTFIDEAKDAEAATKAVGKAFDDGHGSGATGAANNLAKAYEAETEQLKQQLNYLNLLKDARTVAMATQQWVTKVSKGTATKKGVQPTMDQILSVGNLIQQVQDAKKVASEADKIYSDLNGSTQTFFTATKAVDGLLQRGLITRQQYNLEMSNINKTYMQSVDPLGSHIEALQSELKYSELLPQQYDLMTKALNTYNKYADKNRQVSKDEAAQLAILNDQISRNQDVMGNTMSASLDKMSKYMETVTELTSKGAMSPMDARSSIMNSSYGDLLDNTKESVDAQLEEWRKMYTELGEMRKEDQANAKTYARMQATVLQNMFDERLDQTSTILGNLTGLMNTSSKRMFEIGKAASIAQAVVNTYEAATKAWAQGGIYGAILAGTAIAGGMADVMQIKAQKFSGYATGGYVGDASPSEAVGVVHGGEYVINQNATQRNRALLDSINAGKASSTKSSGQVSIKIENQIPTAAYSVQRMDANTVRIIAKQVVESETDRVTSSNIASSYSQTSAALARNTSTRRAYGS